VNYEKIKKGSFLMKHRVGLLEGDSVIGTHCTSTCRL